MYEVRKTPNGWGVYNLTKRTWKSYNTTSAKAGGQLRILNAYLHKAKSNGGGYKIML